jgi:hypothetical protein
MATKILKSIKGKTVRITRLDDCGEVVEGSCSSLVSDCFVSVTIAGEVEAGDEFLVKNAWGDFCINDKDSDRFKWANVTINFAELNPDALDIISNASPVISGSDVIGATFGTSGNESSFALEVWTKRTGQDCAPGDPEWGYFVVPFVKNGRIDGDITIENAALTMTVVGQGFGAPATWDETPYASNPFVEPFPAGELFGMVITDVQPPADTAGCVAISLP